MKIEFNQSALLKGLQRVGPIAEKKTTMPILGNLLLKATGDHLTILATDLEIGIQTKCEANVLQEGQACTPAQNLIDVVKQLPETEGKLQKSDNEWVTITSGKAQFRMAGTLADEFPQVAQTKDFSFSAIRKDTLKKALEKTSIAISTDEMRYNLNGVFLETSKEDGKDMFRMVATDGHRLAMFHRPLQKDESVKIKKGIILPRKGVTELRRLLSDHPETTLDIAIAENAAAFRVGDSVLYMKLVVGEFPDYMAVIPKENKKKLMLNRTVFSDSLKRVSLLSEGKSKCVRLGIRPNGVHLTANSPELGEAEEDLQGEFDGGELNIGFNARYVLDVLSVAGGDKVLLELDHEQSPGVLRVPDDPSFFGVIMPMRI